MEPSSRSADSGFCVHVERDETSPCIRAFGELDLSTAQILLDAVAEAGEPAGLVVDLGGITFIGSTGLAALVELHKRQRTAGSAVSLRNLSPLAAKLLDLTGLSEQFDVEPPAAHQQAPIPDRPTNGSGPR